MTIESAQETGHPATPGPPPSSDTHDAQRAIESATSQPLQLECKVVGSESATRENLPARKPKSPPKEVAEPKLAMRNRLPALEDDADVGVEKEHLVTRDGKADLAFIGTLLASAAPTTAPKGHWEEYRIYQTSAGKHVFSKVTRSIYAEDDDTHAADVFDPNPPSVSSQILRSAREMARSRPLTWTDAAVAFFGYDPLAKALYRKLSVRFEEQIG